MGWCGVQGRFSGGPQSSCHDAVLSDLVSRKKMSMA